MGGPGQDGFDGGYRALRDGGGPVASLLDAAARMLEAESARWFLWLPVLFAGGIVFYFALASEPEPRLAAALVLGALGLCLAMRKATLGLAIGGALMAFALGFATAKLRTEMTRAPVLTGELRYAAVTGFVEEHEGRGKGRARIVLRVLSLGDLAPDERPYRVRIGVSAKAGADARTGEAVRVRATLQPPPEPIEPGGFDFARQAWFARLGAVGYATSRIGPLDHAPELPWDLRAWGAVDALRAEVNARVRTVLPGQSGGIAVALLTGERGGVPEAVKRSMRDSGLAHILAISGLHMMIMAGTMFWLVRALLASRRPWRSAFPSRNGPRPWLYSRQPSIWRCRARRCRPCAPGS